LLFHFFRDNPCKPVLSLSNGSEVAVIDFGCGYAAL